MTELLDCPFCGSSSVDPEGWMSCEPDGSNKRTGPACDDCGASAESDERWNTRDWAPDATLPSPEVLIRQWQADARQLEEAANQEDIGDEEAALNKYIAEQLRKCISQVEAVHWNLDRPCTCHPDEAPVPCQKKYAFSECKASAQLLDRNAVIEECAKEIENFAGKDSMMAAHLRSLCSVTRPDRACEHDWKIWPETDGQSQRCIKCGQYRDTPRPDRGAAE